jgi:hypothetical protein
MRWCAFLYGFWVPARAHLTVAMGCLPCAGHYHWRRACIGINRNYLVAASVAVVDVLLTLTFQAASPVDAVDLEIRLYIFL